MELLHDVIEVMYKSEEFFYRVLGWCFEGRGMYLGFCDIKAEESYVGFHAHMTKILTIHYMELSRTMMLFAQCHAHRTKVS